MKLDLPGLERTADELEADGYVALCETRAVPGLVPLRLVVGGREVLVCRHRMRFVALSGVCPHRGLAMSPGATLEAGQVICPHHRYAFDLSDGHCVTRAACEGLEIFDTETVGGVLYARLTSGETSG